MADQQAVRVDQMSDGQLNTTIEMLQKERARRQGLGPGFGSRLRDIDERNDALRREPAGEGAIGLAATDAAQDMDLDWVFAYHAPNSVDLVKYDAIRSAAKYFAGVLLRNAPASADRSDALRKLRECVMTANASIALRGRIY